MAHYVIFVVGFKLFINEQHHSCQGKDAHRVQLDGRQEKWAKIILTSENLCRLLSANMKSRFQRAMGEVLVVFETLKPNERREFFGMAAKMLLPERCWDDSAPKTGYEEHSEELVSFQGGFSDIDTNTIKNPTNPAASELMSKLQFVSGVTCGRKHRQRDLRKKLNKLRRLTRKALKATKTQKPCRGSKMFFYSLICTYVSRQSVIERLRLKFN